jgi:tetratricopeptide (TPR) repeat protein
MPSGDSPGERRRTAYFSPRDQERASEAEAILQEAIRSDPGDPVNQQKLGDIVYEQERYVEAEAAYEKAAGLDPGNATHLGGLGRALLAQKRYPEAEATLLEAARLDPDNPLYHGELGRALLAQKRYAEAEATLLEAARLDPDNSLYEDELRQALLAQKRYPEAEAMRPEGVITDRSPASGVQVVGMTLGASVGAVFGVIAIITAAALTNSIGIEVWVLFTICESLALITGVITLRIRRQRDEFVTSAVGFVMHIEDFLGSPEFERTSTFGPLKLVTPEHSEAAARVMLSDAQRWSVALEASRDLDIAARLQYSIERLQHPVGKAEASPR